MTTSQPNGQHRNACFIYSSNPETLMKGLKARFSSHDRLDSIQWGKLL